LAVCGIKGLDCKTQFATVLNNVAEEMNLKTSPIKRTAESNCDIATDQINNCNSKNNSIAKQQQSHTLNVVKMPMNENHIEYWKNLGVKKELLDKYKVSAIFSYSFFSYSKNKTFKFVIKNELIAFCYEVANNFEIYVPSQPKWNQKKYFNNGLGHNDIFGLEQLPTKKVENLIITAGKKDAIVTSAKGFNTVCFRSETHNPTIDQINYLQNQCKNLFICYDNDRGGKEAVEKLAIQFANIIPIYLPTNKKIKGYDLTDFFLENTSEYFQNLLDSALNSKNKNHE
jgi:5S rRNA maturation endonuclease (ribonuclease M5)